MIKINHYSLVQVREKTIQYDLNRKVMSTDDVVKIGQALDLEDYAAEHFVIITLNTKHEIAGVHTISIGDLNSAVVHPREVFKAALLNNAFSVICLHNHPSGDPSPSKEDISITLRLCEAGKLLGITVVDHVIIGGNGRYTSMRENGIIEGGGGNHGKQRANQ